MSFRPGHVGGRRAGAGVLDRDSFGRRRLSRALIRMRRAWEMTRLTSGSLPGLVDPQPGQEVEDARVAPHVLRELVVPAAGEVVEQLAVLELPQHRGAREVVHDGGELAEVAEQ